MITQKKLKKLINYNPKTGVFTWLERTPDMFEDGKYPKKRLCHKWNACYSGKQAGWTSRGYIQIKINGKSHQAHILAHIYMTGKKPIQNIDHKNGNPGDNKWCNLRLATPAENNANSKIRTNNSSGYKGVSFHKISKKWQAKIQTNGKQIYLGLFDTPQKAHKDYCKFAKKYHGKYARLA